MNDETLQIHEPPCRNSGVLGGKFLQRGKWKTTDGVVIMPGNCLPGMQVVINHYTFEVCGADDATLKWLKDAGQL